MGHRFWIDFHCRRRLDSCIRCAGYFWRVRRWPPGRRNSSPLLEKAFVHGVLGRPSRVLLEKKPQSGLRKIYAALIGQYFQPINDSLTDSLAQLPEEKRAAVAEAVFRAAVFEAKKHQVAYVRMDTFLRLYGFCRNVAFVALVAAVTFAIVGLFEVTGDEGWNSDVAQKLGWSAAAAAAGLGLVVRYLKFYRLYALEAFLVLDEIEIRKLIVKYAN